MSVEVHRTDDGIFVVADGGGWLPGNYPSKEMALAAAACDHGALSRWWSGIRQRAEVGELVKAAWKEGFWTGPDGPEHIRPDGEEHMWLGSDAYAAIRGMEVE